MRNDYYSNGKRGMEGGVPVWRPSWWNELGNDKEFIEATRPRTSFKQSYYENGHRMIVDGIPVRVAAYVKGWAPWMKRALFKGTGGSKEAAEIEAQLPRLFPSYVPKNARGVACCIVHKNEYRADSDCYQCKADARQASYEAEKESWKTAAE